MVGGNLIEKMKIWILNHYATEMYFDGAGRHHAFAKYLKMMGHETKIFCANTVHNSTDVINLQGDLYSIKNSKDNITYVFVETRSYTGNGKDRLRNMVTFWKNVKKTCKDLMGKGDKPDVILASSVHPLTLVAGEQLGKKYNIPCICEIRDLWPETLVRFGKLKSNSILTSLLYKGEKWIYKRASALIFTMEGGKQYITNRKWQDSIDLKKVFYINNGVDLEVFDEDKIKYQIQDTDLESDIFKIVYTGTIGEANRVDILVDVAEKLQENNISNVKIIVFGSGMKENELKIRVEETGLQNIVFKGRVEKKYIPYILSKADANILLLENNSLYEYGISLNKSFEYLASGKPIVMNSTCRYNYMEENDCAVINSDLHQSVLNLLNMNKTEYIKFEKNARNAAHKFDYKVLTNKLESIITQCLGGYK